jgi:hypothetical protein
MYSDGHLAEPASDGRARQDAGAWLGATADGRCFVLARPRPPPARSTSSNPRRTGDGCERAGGRKHPQPKEKADAGTRTPDPFITSEVLYQLSYVGTFPANRTFPPAAVAEDKHPESGRRAQSRAPDGMVDTVSASM